MEIVREFPHDLRTIFYGPYGNFREESQISTNQNRKKQCFLASDWLKFENPSPKIPYSSFT